MRPFIAIHTYENFPKMFHFFYLADYSKVSTFFWDTRYMRQLLVHFLSHAFKIKFTPNWCSLFPPFSSWDNCQDNMQASHQFDSISLFNTFHTFKQISFLSYSSHLHKCIHTIINAQLTLERMHNFVRISNGNGCFISWDLDAETHNKACSGN